MTEAASRRDFAAEGRPPAISLRNVSKSFGSVEAVSGVSLEILDGEFLTLLGPSGSGKTTVLRMIAGFEMPTSGKILLNGNDVSSEPAFKRDVNTVFQDYALFPHMTVAENVEYGMRVRKTPKVERVERRDEALRMVRLSELAERTPSQLSGGQRQRVALARAIVNKPRVLLLDEPLGALDLKLREEMQTELKALQRTLKITFVYVTHDQGEALSMSDRIAVFNQGHLEQVGGPRDLYEHPSTAFVAGFVGIANLFDEETSQRLFSRRSVHTLRPERVRVLPPSATEGHSARVVDSQYLGAEIRLTCRLEGGGIVVASIPSTQERAPSRDEQVTLSWEPQAVFEVTDNR
jgi:putative spermidine/putrescine transport system ATP-binding protein